MQLGQLWNRIIQRGSESGLTETEFLEAELSSWLRCDKRLRMITGQRYYVGRQDILHKERTAIGQNGRETPLHNLPNSRLTDNRYAELVDQKVAYLLSNAMDVKTEETAYGQAVRKVLGKGFRKTLKLLGEDALNAGVAFLHPYISEEGDLKLRRFPPQQILPFWKDEEHEELDCFIRLYSVIVYNGRMREIVYKAEYYTPSGIRYYTWENEKLIPDNASFDTSYISRNGQRYNWNRAPLIAFKYNQNELPLIAKVKCLQDALNTLLSDLADNMRENVRNTVLVLENYEGEDLSSFRRNLAAYGVVKVGTDDARRGDVRRLSIDVDGSNYDLVVKLLKRAIIENGHGFDSKDDRMSQNPNQMNIRSIYADIDLDADNMEMEMQAGLERMMWFVDAYLGLKQMRPSPVEFIFHRDTPINEAEIIDNCVKSEGVISQETILANHPWVKSVDEEKKRLESERQADEISGEYVNRREEHDESKPQ